MKRFLRFFSALLVLIIVSAPVTTIAYAATADQLKNKVVDIAQGEVGYTGSSSYSKYGDWYGYQGSWCTTFVMWCYYKAGSAYNVSLYGKIVPSGGNCNSMISWYKNKGRYKTRSSGYTPSKGDLVFFDWNSDGSSDHVGIVSGTSGSTVYTIEGNCSGKVKSKTYTTSGSKPYGNVSSIMGYGNPDFNSVAGGSSNATTTKKATTTTKQQTTTKKQTTTAKQNQTTKKPTGNTTTQKSTTTKPTTTETTTSVILPTDMKLYAATYDLEIGDSVHLDYSVEPANSQAVVGYFCDQNDIVEITNGGEIKAKAEGVATVVVCANDEIYRQVDFKVSKESVSVTRHTGDIVEQTTAKPVVDKTKDQKWLEAGINIQKLKSHKDNFIYPIYIISATVVISAITVLIRKAVIKRKNKNKVE